VILTQGKRSTARLVRTPTLATGRRTSGRRGVLFTSCGGKSGHNKGSRQTGGENIPKTIFGAFRGHQPADGWRPDEGGRSKEFGPLKPGKRRREVQLADT